jgi:hypothetical protein
MSSDVTDLQIHGTNGGYKRPTHGSVEESCGKGPLRRSKRRWMNNIKMDLMFTGPCIVIIF